MTPAQVLHEQSLGERSGAFEPLTSTTATSLLARPSAKDLGPAHMATLGMLIIDEFIYLDPTTGSRISKAEHLRKRGIKGPSDNDTQSSFDAADDDDDEQIGGGGVYFVIGARVWSRPQEILSILDVGPNFTPKMRDKLRSFDDGEGSSQSPQSMWVWRDRPEGTTRAANIYTGEKRGFEYLTPKRRLDPQDLSVAAPGRCLPRWIHAICSPDRIVTIVQEALLLSKQQGQAHSPRIVWEPIPDSARPENLDGLLEAAGMVDVLSPNHVEAHNFLDTSRQQSTPGYIADLDEPSLTPGEFKLQVEKDAHDLLRLCAAFGSHAPLLVIRAGKHGSVALNQGCVESVWCAPYHGEDKQHEVVDVTGAGNAFLGGLTWSLAQIDEPNLDLGELDKMALGQALKHGAVSASYVVEQRGMPRVTPAQQPEEGSVLKWNHHLTNPSERYAAMQ
ncbi:PROTEIN MAK32 [Ceraceosorus bombacis]|uniref:PROTEIN MAK32 n=1 Tax=Ceraceosorus bombacis TaxID=401625 RepID=A0A0P1BGL0_9BASI|nr:PROTEIN MAK32 [Ceraceosorus bombacis]